MGLKAKFCKIFAKFSCRKALCDFIVTRFQAQTAQILYKLQVNKKEATPLIYKQFI